MTKPLGRCQLECLSAEADLVRAAQDGDRRAEELLIRAHAGLVRRIARPYAARVRAAEDRRDIEAAGTIGLIEAIRRHDVTLGKPLRAIAWPTIRRAVQEQASQLTSIAKLPVRQFATGAADLSLATPIGGDEGRDELINVIDPARHDPTLERPEQPDQVFERAELREVVRAAIRDVASDDTARMIMERILAGDDQAEIAASLGITRQAISLRWGRLEPRLRRAIRVALEPADPEIDVPPDAWQTVIAATADEADLAVVAGMYRQESLDNIAADAGLAVADVTDRVRRLRVALYEAVDSSD